MGRSGLGEVVAQLLVDGELARAAGFGILQDHVTDVGQLDVARVEDLDAEHFVAGSDGSQRTHPINRAEEVADDDRHSAAAFRTTQRVDRDRQIPAHPDRRLGHGRDGAQHRLLVLPSGPGWYSSYLLAVGNQRTKPVSSATVEVS